MVIVCTPEQLHALVRAAVVEALDLQAGPAQDDEPEFLNRAEAAKMLRVTVQSIDNYAQRGTLRKYYPGGGRRPLFKRAEILALLERPR
jgi:hypothetical protein